MILFLGFAAISAGSISNESISVTCAFKLLLLRIVMIVFGNLLYINAGKRNCVVKKIASAVVILIRMNNA